MQGSSPARRASSGVHTPPPTTQIAWRTAAVIADGIDGGDMASTETVTASPTSASSPT